MEEWETMSVNSYLHLSSAKASYSIYKSSFVEYINHLLTQVLISTYDFFL